MSLNLSKINWFSSDVFFYELYDDSAWFSSDVFFYELYDDSA